MDADVGLDAEGLSPRVRGNLNRGARGMLPTRSIPACAGEPCSASVASRSARVYPRVCGGTCRCSTIVTPGAGLSPRVRGNRGLEREVLMSKRSIPACAGEPVTAFGRRRI